MPLDPKEEVEISNDVEALKLQVIGTKRTDYIPWDEYFMAVAFLTAMRSKDPCSQVGACIVNREKKIVGVGYNGMPTGIQDDQLPWGKESDNPLENKYMYVCHAEMNAIMNKNSSDLADCIIYVALFPCNECAKLIIQSGIREVLYMSDKHHQKKETIASKRMLDMAQVSYRQYSPKQNEIVIDFTLKSKSNGGETIDVSTCNGVNTIKKKETKRDINKRREDHLQWGEYFMALATLSALRSKDPLTRVGACIINKENKIVGIGYNGMPWRCSDDLLPWSENVSDKLQSKHMYVCHAEVNAIMNKNCGDVFGCNIYVAQFPCNECAKVIIQAGIKKVVYLADDRSETLEVIASKKMLDLVGIPYRPYELPRRKIVINFDTINWNSSTQSVPM